MTPEERNRLIEYLRLDRRLYDSQAEERLAALWREASMTEDADEEGLARLRREMKEPRRGRRSMLWRVMATVTGVAVACAIFAAGWWVAYSPQETIFITEPTHHVLSTASGSVGQFTLPDGTRVWLNSNSRLEYDGEMLADRSVKLHGEGYFDVKRDVAHPFTLSLDNMRVEVLGTRFDARCYGDGMIEDVVLRSGKVDVYHRNGNVLANLLPDERVVLDPMTGESEKTSVEAIDYCSWMKERQRFSNAPLQSVITNIERRYNIEIELGSGIDPRQRITLTVMREPVTDVLNVLGTLTRSNVRFKSPGKVVLSR